MKCGILAVLRSRLWLAVSLCAMMLLVSASGPVSGVHRAHAADKGGKAPKPIVVPANPTPREVNTFLAGLTDEQVCQALRQELEEKASKQQHHRTVVMETSGFTRTLDALERATAEVRQKLSELKSGHYEAPKLLSESLTQIHPTIGGGRGVLLTLLALLGLALGGACTEWLFRRYTGRLRDRLATARLSSLQGKVKDLLLLAFLDFIGIFMFALGVLGLFFLFFEGSGNVQYRRLVLLGFLTIVVIVRAVVVAANLVFAPAAPGLRLVPVNDASARSYRRWLTVFAALLGASLLMRTLLELNQAEPLVILGQRAFSGLVFLAVAVILAYSKRAAISSMIGKLSWRSAGEPSLLMQVADYWHLVAIPFAAALYGLWLVFLLIGEQQMVLAFLALFLSAPLFVVLNALAQHLLDLLAYSLEDVNRKDVSTVAPHAVEESDATRPPVEETEQSKPLEGPKEPPPPVSKVSGSETKGWDVSRMFPVARSVTSSVIAATIGIGVLSFWGVRLPIGATLVKAAIQVLVTSILIYVVWRLINRAINTRLERVGALKRDREEEMGGKGGSRVGTLLILFRKFLFVVLMTTFILIVLSAAGVNIAPLLAGAGVVGLAIGFGSQSLVKDIVSGIFFLVDDAFRIGDYVVAGSVKGTVEHISIRSVQLRHHRGMVITVPFSDLKSVTNYSRDYIVDKLDFGVPYDTDLEKVRKIVKKISQELKADEEFGPKMLDAIKSQGVRQIDDSAMTVRVKLRTRPGDQFILRREVYKRLQKAFQKAGIEFARRQVIVRLPEDEIAHAGAGGVEGKPAPKVLSAGAAAGAAIQMAVEEELARQEAVKSSSKS